MSVDRVMTRLNPLIRFVLASPAHGLLSWGMMLLTVQGRRSGRRYTFPVGYQMYGPDVIVLASEAQRKSWWRNLREPGGVELRLRGRTRTGRGELVAPGSPDFGRHVEALLRRMPSLARVFKVDFDPKIGLSDAQRSSLGEEIAVVHIRLDDEAPTPTR